MSKYNDASFIMPQAPYIKAGEIEVLKPVSGGNLTVDRNSIASYIDSNGLEQKAGLNIARFTYDEGSKCPYLLTEPQATNLLPYSNDFTDVSWVKFSQGSGLIPSITPAYDSYQGVDATRFIFSLDGGSTSNDRSFIQTSYQTTAGEESMFSILIKSNTIPVSIVLDTESSSTETINVTTEWTVLSSSRVAATTTNRICKIGLTGSFSDEYADVSIVYAQLENNSYPTSRITTTGSVLTRLKDEITGGGDVNTFNSNELVLEVSMKALADDKTTRVLGISDGTLNNRMRIAYTADTNSLAFALTVNGIEEYSFNTTVSDITKNSVFKLKCKTNDFGSKVDGVELDTQNSGTMASAGTFNTIELANGVGNFNLFAKTKYIQVYNTIEQY